MGSIQELRHRIKTIKSTQKITKAIKMVATVRLKKAQTALVVSRRLPSRLEELWNNLIAMPNFMTNHPLISSNQTLNKITLLVITSDQGLCGGFNTLIIQRAKELLLTEFKGKQVYLMSIGNKGNEAFKYHKITVQKKYDNFFEAYSLDKVSSLVQELSNQIINGDSDSVYIIYTKLGLSYRTSIELEQILPLTINKVAVPETKGMKKNWLVEPSIDNVVTNTCEMFLVSELHRIFQESLSCEQLARMQAMEAATKNADETLQDLNILFNKTRQELITREMLEVISGTESSE